VKDDLFRARTREELAKLRQPPTPALSECRTLTLDEALEEHRGHVAKQLQQQRQLMQAEDVRRVMQSLPAGSMPADLRAAMTKGGWTRGK